MDAATEQRLDNDDLLTAPYRPAALADDKEQKPHAKRPLQEVIADWDEDSATPLSLSPRTPTLPPDEPTLASSTSSEHPDYYDKWNVRITWDNAQGCYIDTSDGMPATPPSSITQSNVTTSKHTKRRAPVRFDADQVLLMGQLRAAGYTLAEIADYFTSKLGGVLVTPDQVRQRLLHGPTVVKPKRVITDEVVAQMLKHES